MTTAGTATPAAPGEGRIDVALCADHGFVMPLAVTLASLAASSAPGRVTVHVVNSGYDAALQRRLLLGAPQLDVRWYEFDRAALAGVNNTDHLSDAALYRLLLGQVLPADVRRVLYVDADTLVTDDVAALAGFDLAGRTLAAVRDSVSPWAAGVYGADWEPLGIDPSSPYFNSGVLLIDLDRWRQEGSGSACIDLLRRVDARWGDQDALNKVFEGAWTELPRRWNVQTADLQRDSFSWALAREEAQAAVERPGIVHFTSREKPWKPGGEHPASQQWFATLDVTDWRGWRPPPAVHEHRGAMKMAAGVVRELRRRRLERLHRLPR